MSIADALSALSQAHGSQALASAFRALQGQVRRDRRAKDASRGTLATTYIAAMAIWDAQKADGIPRAERLSGLEKSLRAAWPQTREWKYLCERCSDYGLEILSCQGVTDAICGEVKPHYAHEFGQPCWCAAGARFREKPKPAPEDFQAAGKSKPMTRVGR